MNVSWRTEVPQWLILAGMLIAAAVLWPYAPDAMPVHWNIKGEVDRFGGKIEGLLAIPLLALFLYGLLVILPRFDPARANYASFQSAFAAIRIGILVFFAGMYAVMLLVAFGFPLNLNRIIPIGVGCLFLLIGNFMGKLRPNWFCGIRTPWTLSSRKSWNQSHRLGGWLFMLMGVVEIFCGIIPTVWMLIVMGVVTVGSVITMLVYSYLVWKSDPERISASDVSPAGDDEKLPE